MLFGIIKYFIVKYCQILLWILTPIWMRFPLVGVIYLLLKRIILRSTNVRPVPIVDDYQITENDTPREFRTFEGSWNHQNKPSMGMSGCPFARNVRPLKNPCGGPDVVNLSRVLLKRRGRAKMSKLVNLLGGAWAQFMIQDWFLHKLDKEKKISFDLGNNEMMNINAFAKMTMGDESFNINSTDHWWSCSQIYGYTKEQSEKRRTHVDGKLIVDDKGFIPINPETGIEEVGFPRNMWTGLSLLHWLFTAEHNRVCNMLKSYYPELNNDELLYQKARLIICAMIARIHVVEWSTAMIQNPLGRASQYFTWYGVFGTLVGSKIKMPWNGVVSSLFGGIPGNSNRFANDQNYAHSDEYSAIFRMHSLIPEEIHIKTIPNEGEQDRETVHPINEFFFQKSSQLLRERGVATLAYTLGMGRTGEITLRNHPSFFDKFHVPHQGGFGVEGDSNEYLIDMGAADIFRCREMKLPLFNEFRRQYNLRAYKSFKEFTNDQELLEALNSVYGGDIERMDTYIGMMGEKRMPGFAFGETIYTIFVLQTQRRLESDRFFTTDFNKQTYTAKGLKIIEETTMSEIIRRNIPELRRFLEKNDNAFIPWDIYEKRKIHEKVICDMLFPHTVNHWFCSHRYLPPLTRFLPPHMDRKHHFFEDGELHPFSPSSVSFDVVNAWWLNEACFLSYFEEPYFQRMISRSLPSSQVILLDNHKNTQVHVIYTNQYIWAIFRGTEWWPKGGANKGSYFTSVSDDWTVDIDKQFVQEGDREGVCVHRQFQCGLNDVWNDLLKAIDTAKQGYNEKPIFFAGHSVGGAIATIAGLRYGYHGKVHAVYTFGAPAVGNSAYVNDFNSRGPMCFNVVNSDDVFPRLLVPQLLHPGLYAVLTKDRKLRLHESQKSSQDSSKGVVGGKTKSLLDRLIVDYAVLDHSPVVYSTQLWNQISH